MAGILAYSMLLADAMYRNVITLLNTISANVESCQGEGLQSPVPPLKITTTTGLFLSHPFSSEN